MRLDGDKLPDWEHMPVVVKLPVPGLMASFVNPENGHTALMQYNSVDPPVNGGRCALSQSRGWELQFAISVDRVGLREMNVG